MRLREHELERHRRVLEAKDPLRRACHRRSLGGRGRHGGGGGGSAYLLDYSAATFTRSSEAAAVDPREGWAWYDLATPWPVVDVARILPDGEILIEGSRTNRLLHSAALSNAAWVKGGTTTVTAGVADGLDGSSSTADRIALDASIFQTAPNADFADFSSATGSVWLWTESGSTTVRLEIRRKDGSVVTSSDLTITTTPTRHALTVADMRTGATDPYLAILDGSTNPNATVVAWGAQLESEAGFASSPIRTTTAQATRALEKPSFLDSEGSPWPERINSGKFAIDVWPSWSSSEAPAGQFAYILANGNSDVFYLYKNGSTLEVRLQAASVNVITAFGITFSADQKLTFTIDWPAQELTVEGATTGNGTVAITATDFTMDPATDRLAIGHSASTAGREFYGVIGRPRAA